METYAARRFLVEFGEDLPKNSPIDFEYKPPKFKCFKETHQLLRNIHHRWRCEGNFQNFFFSNFAKKFQKCFENISKNTLKNCYQIVVHCCWIN